MIRRSNRPLASSGLNRAVLLCLLVLFPIPSIGNAEVPQISCPGTVVLTLDDLGEVMIEVPITGADSVTVSTAGGSWVNDTLTLSVTRPLTDTVTITATTTESDTAICDIIIEFPGVTKKSGSISGEIWNAFGSPYCIVGNVSAASITIEPGTEILFFGNYVFEITGIITAEGTASQRIRFSSPSIPGDDLRWGGMLFQSKIPGSLLKYCEFRNTRSSAVRIINTVVSIDYCNFENNTAVCGAALWIALDKATDTLRIQHSMVVDNSTSSVGGGIRADLSKGVLRLSSCVLSDNYAVNAGGGVYSSSGEGALILERCSLLNNECHAGCWGFYCKAISQGGGLYSAGNIAMYNCLFGENVSSAHGIDATFGSAHSWTYGGAIYIAGGSFLAQNTIVSCNLCNPTGNDGRRYGGGAYVNGGTADFDNTTIAYNVSEGVYSAGSDSVHVVNSIVWFNANSGTQLEGTCATSYSNVQNGWAGMGNIDMGPVFVNSGGCGIEDLRIIYPSPSIDAGNPDPTYNDPDGSRNDQGAFGGPYCLGWATEPVIGCPEGMVDASRDTLSNTASVPLSIGGADEVWCNSCSWSDGVLMFTADTLGVYAKRIVASNPIGADTCDIIVRVDDPTDVAPSNPLASPDHFSLTQNYPNPFNPTTIIEYSLASRTQVTIVVFNALGQKVRTLVNEEKSAGSYRVDWNGDDETGKPVSTGLYLYRFQAGDIVQTKKMLLIK